MCEALEFVFWKSYCLTDDNSDWAIHDLLGPRILFLGGGGDSLGSKWGDRIVEILELPRDVVQDLPRLVLTGDRRLVIENHKGVIEYTSALLRLNTSRGELRVEGKSLTLVSILREEIWIEGHIEHVEFFDWGE